MMRARELAMVRAMIGVARKVDSMVLPRACAAAVLLAIIVQPVAARWPSISAWGPGNDDRPNGLAIDGAGNVVYGGGFSGTVNLGGMNVMSAGQRDALLLKSDGDGNLLWSRAAGGPVADDIFAVAADAAGDIYVVGALCFQAAGPGDCSATFGNLGVTSVPAGRENAFVAKINGAGQWQWVREIVPNAGSALRLNGVAVAGGEVFVSGWFSGSVMSPTGGGFSRSSRTDRTDAFFAKLSAAGAWQATQTWPGLPELSGHDYKGTSIVAAGGRVLALGQGVTLPQASNSLIITGGPTYTLPGGGSCSVSGQPSRGSGATVTCSGVNLAAHTNVYFGVKNNTAPNGNTMTGTQPSGAAVFNFSSSDANSITYASATTINNVLGSSAQPVSNQMIITRTAGSATVVPTGGVPANNANGQIERLFRLDGGSSFTFTVQVRSSTAGIVGFGISNPHVYDPTHTTINNGDIARVDLGFYYSSCGDGILEGDEVCDDGQFNGTATSCCTSTCTERADGHWCPPSTDVRLLSMAPSDLALQTSGGIGLGFAAERIASDDGARVAVVGRLRSGASVTYGSSTVMGPGLVVGRANLAGAGGPLTRNWAALARDTAQFFGSDVTFGALDDIYVTSTFGDELEFVPSTISKLFPAAEGIAYEGEDIFVAALDDVDGKWLWRARAGGAGYDWPKGIAVDRSHPQGDIAIAGSYTAVTAFGDDFQFGLCTSKCTRLQGGMTVEFDCNALNEQQCTLTSCQYPLFCVGGVQPPAATGFTMKLSTDGDWLLPVDRWVVGQKIPRPAGLPALEPSVEIPGLTPAQVATYFLWGEFDKELYAIRPTADAATIRWRKSTDPLLGTEPVSGIVRFPNNPQIHMGGAPVDVELSAASRCGPNSPRPYALCTTAADCGTNGGPCAPLAASARWTFAGIRYQTPDSDALVDAATRVFNATGGTATLVYVNGTSADPSNGTVQIVVVRTVDPIASLSGAPAACTVGTAVTDPAHVDPNRKNGWVVNPLSHFDGAGQDAAYIRDVSRAGTILPVNVDNPGDMDDDIVVAWYAQDSRGIAWANRALRYDCTWPATPDSIVVASELGSDGRCKDVRSACQFDEDCSSGPCIVQPPLLPANFPNARIYGQSDPMLPGFNPNEEHALLLPSNAGTGANAVFAMRTDLNTSGGHSEPYVLLKYGNPATRNWAMRVYRVSLTDGPYTSTYPATAGGKIDPPYPLPLLPACSQSCAPLLEDCVNFAMPSCIGSRCVGGSLAGASCGSGADCRPSCLGATDPLCGDAGSNGALFKDHKGIGPSGSWQGWWARSAGTIASRYHYPIQQGFFTDFDLDGTPDLEIGHCEPWLLTSPSQQLTVHYDVAWPANPPVLHIGETLLSPKRGLPEIRLQAAAEIVFETTSITTPPINQPAELVRLIDPLSPRRVPLTALPMDLVTERRGPTSRIVAGQAGTRKLSPGVAARISHDATSQTLAYEGVFDGTRLGEPLLLLNVMTERDRDELLALSTSAAWSAAIEKLFALTRNPDAVDEDNDGEPDDKLHIGFAMDGDTVVPKRFLGGAKALTAGLAGGEGYVTVAFNNHPTLGALPVSLQVLRVECGTYQGQVHVLPASNIFDEQVTLIHSGDFAGDPSGLDFEWYYTLKEKDCQSIPVPPFPDPVLAPWIPFDGGEGVSSVTFGGPGITSLADTCVLARYRGYPLCANDSDPSQWAGAPFGPSQAIDPKSQLVPGWLTRVTEGLNPFDQRTTDFRNSAVDTFANLLVSAGERFEGPIAFNPDASAINDIGLIEAYETVLDRGRDLSINEGLSIGAVNSKLLDVAARISDLYVMLGNEAYGDALDPTIGFRTTGSTFGTAAPAIFAFQDQMESLLGEELALLRGSETSGGARPIYNRLIWNFTGRDGQVAYQQNYNITDQDGDGDIDEFDARILYPQGHGDAWGHYLTAIAGYYRLLRHPDFVWLPRSDSVLVAGSEVLVDFTDERRFAASAAARARTGAQIVDLTYRRRWVDDPAGQYQGYKDTDPDRAFGVSEWAQRTGQGAYFDWVVANAILPPHSDAPPGIEKIDRTTVPELTEIVAHARDVESQLDLVDGGMNPLGLAKNVVPFDIDPTFLEVSSTVQGLTHYEQIAGRAGEALANAVRVFDHANGLTQLLRRNQDSSVDFGRNVAAQERDYNNRLIEIFGTPYPEDIGPTGTYRAGYAGPDIWNWEIVDASEITGEIPGFLTDVTSGYQLQVATPDWDTCPNTNDGTCRFDSSSKLKFASDGTVVTVPSTVRIELSNLGYGRVKNPSWSMRQAPGELQLARSDLLQKRAQFEKAVANYSRLIGDIECTLGTIRGQSKLAEARLDILERTKNTKLSLNAVIFAAKGVELGLKRASSLIREFAALGSNALPTVVGLATDATSSLRSLLKGVGVSSAIGIDIAADVAELAQLGAEQAAEIQAQVDGIKLRGIEDDFEIYNLLGTLGERLRQEPVLRLEALTLAEATRQSAAQMQRTLARGVRVIDELEAFRKKTASQVADSRYADMAFRVFRNDALQKYRAQLDLTSRYVYLAATAYDYETNLQGADARAGRRFLTDIVRQRSLGQVVNGVPLAGSQGLGDVLARMNANFAVLKGQLGFNNPQTETNRFSLRSELFRILDASDENWRSTLAAHRVNNLWDVREFRRFARPPADESAGPLPGIVIPIPTTVTFGLNFFGWPLAGGDSAYDPTNFATKTRTIGVWFGNYNGQGLSNTPRVYLIPTGADVLRTPASGNFRTRNWTVLDQRIPVPFPIGQSALDSQTWIPALDSLSDPIGGIRQYSSFRAFHDTGVFDPAQVTTDSRSIGRSVWNTRWMLVIPGGTLLADANEALNTLIYGRRAPGSGTVIDPAGVARDGKGIDDILLFFQTYAYSGN